MDWILKPYESFGTLHFGMSKDDVESLIGPAKRSRDVSDLEIEMRGVFLPQTHYKMNRLVEIELYADAGEVIIKDVHLFHGNRDSVRNYIFSQGELYEGAGVFVSFSLGLSTNLFHTSSTPSAAVFSKGYWDRSKTNLKRIE